MVWTKNFEELKDDDSAAKSYSAPTSKSGRMLAEEEQGYFPKTSIDIVRSKGSKGNSLVVSAFRSACERGKDIGKKLGSFTHELHLPSLQHLLSKGSEGDKIDRKKSAADMHVELIETFLKAQRDGGVKLVHEERDEFQDSIAVGDECC
ncbi:hypothetical protein GUITHDRAFT_117005 [Guillardia theta CCMP2712]|uniref:Uncharacterized protein n=1 Tax=Guillardia theta (strain CCMP2712) TaxID=905079 RepID=L1ILT5_GUITC|nr:hypothetical protein GUITHDRAFT_117005 [Guillardia theta CCMP2712]EKX36839.1 hypothetical protein GUITHDRAFT_117005 [Guillardia theta CCMP2712]|mmetsp:Transcript_30457/g.98183  ORF Transcript_30457/g.98183 Transcript_30457/m.98183 type:complete len:149 (-) Transcript_30457:1547-1993(-)|eukprot:XP_005823819.1 hypothetical protein GUITHDRAFT_117005 [Guillardia theta CCMP2712]